MIFASALVRVGLDKDKSKFEVAAVFKNVLSGIASSLVSSLLC